MEKIEAPVTTGLNELCFQVPRAAVDENKATHVKKCSNTTVLYAAFHSQVLYEEFHLALWKNCCSGGATYQITIR